jgi:glycosyltransferase involved in cell wall biosynthesis
MDAVNVKVLLALLGTGIPVVISERSVLSLPSQVGDRLRTRIVALLRHVLYPAARALIVQSRMVADEARKMRLSRNVQVISNVSFPPPPTDVAHDGKTVLAVGRLGPEKGHDILIRAFALVAAQSPEWRIKIVGAGPCYAMLKALAQDLGIQGRIDLAPVTHEIWPAYQAAEIFVLPSRYEGFPNVLVEAMRAGCAVIISDCAGAGTEIVSDKEDGLVFRTDDIQGLADRLAGLMSDPHKRAALGEQARRSVKRYDPDVILPLWDSLIDAIA